MKKTWNATLAVAAIAACLAATQAHAAIRITEWMYNGLAAGNAGEYIEITNLGGAAVDLTGWSFDDNGRTPGAQSLSAFGILAAGESAVLGEATATDFRTEWGLAATVKVIGGNTNNLGRSDEINIYDADDLGNAPTDRLTYGDQDFPGSPRAQNVSGNPMTAAALGANAVTQWQLAVNGDAYGSHISVTGDIGNPGINRIPEPATAGLAVLAAAALVRRRRA